MPTGNNRKTETMTSPKRANDMNVLPCWKVRICLRGGVIIHVLSKTEPMIEHANGEIIGAKLDYIHDTEHGDTIGFICWKDVAAVSWRNAPLATAEE
jgi:hypothetical protein